MADTRIARIIRHRRRQRQARENSAPKVMRLMGCSVFTALISLIIVVSLALGGAVGVYAYYARELPPADSIVQAQEEAFLTTTFYDRTGQFAIYEVIDPNGGDRQYATLSDLPEHFLQATIAIEDANFYENPGFNVRGLARATWSNLQGNELQGGSSITQQLVKNVLIPPDERTTVSFERKFKELILASEISRLYSKDQILEWYVNTNFYGNLAYGVEAAARVYFDKPARDLTLAESAVLAAIPQFPLQNPIDNSPAARERQELVLERMVAVGFLTPLEAQTALNEELVIKPFARRFSITAPHFSLYARSETEAILNYLGYDGPRLISQGGLRVYTTLDLDLQQQFECVARSHVERLSSGDGTFVHNTTAGSSCFASEYLRSPSQAITAQPRTVTNASGVVLNAQTGEIVSMVGSVDYWDETIDGNFNGALALRQPASTFKPFVYVTAFLSPFDGNTNVVTPAFMTADVYTEFDNGQEEPYIPLNIDRQFHGPVSVRNALARSYNVPAVQVLSLVGLTEVLKVAHAMGINSMNENISQYGLSLALGTAESSLLDMTYAYNTFNNLGTMVGRPIFFNDARPGYRQLDPVSVLRIEDANGKILWEYNNTAGTFDRRSVLEPGMAYMITDILADNEARVDAFGQGNVLELSRPAAAKTGTSDDFRDSWTIGYTPQYTVGVWVGNNDNRPMEEVTGLVGAAPIWHAIMEYVHTRDNLPVVKWTEPNTITRKNVCLLSGLLATDSCPQRTEIFFYDPISGNDYSPTRSDTYWVVHRVNTCNNTLATAYSPAECVAEATYFEYPSEMREWAENNPVDLPPTEIDRSGTDSLFNTVAIISPSFLEKVSGTVEITGNAIDENLFYYYLEVGEGANPEQWQRISENESEGGRGVTVTSWDTTSFEDGLHTLRLIMVREDQTLERAVREVIIDNTPPTVRLTEPRTDKAYSRERDVFIELVAEAFDNDQIDYVEFYVDGVLVETTNQAPYSYRWEIHEFPEARVWVVVFDAAGNRTESEPVTITLED